MYKVEDKFTLKVLENDFAVIIGVSPGGQSMNKKTVYQISFAGTILSIDEDILGKVFEPLQIQDALDEYAKGILDKTPSEVESEQEIVQEEKRRGRPAKSKD